VRDYELMVVLETRTLTKPADRSHEYPYPVAGDPARRYG